MATPTWAEVWSQLTKLVDIYDTIRTNGQTSVVSKLDTYVQAVEGDGAANAAGVARGTRAAYAALLDRFRANALPHLEDLAIVINTPHRPPGPLFWRDLREYMIDNSYSVNSRGITFGSVTAGGSNVGTGTIYRLTTDAYDQPIEHVHLNVVTARCIADANSGTLAGRERFELRHRAALPDRLSEAGSGVVTTLTGHAGDEILTNAAFTQLNGTTSSLTTLPGWTVGTSISNFEYDATNYYNTPPSGTAYSLKIKATETIAQKLSTNNRRLNPDVPYMALVRWNREVGSATGTLVLRMGSETASVTAAAQTGWQTLALAMDGDKWLRQFNEADLDLMVDWTRTGGNLLAAHVLFGPMTQFDGLWYFAAGGATHWRIEDEYTFTDELAGSDGKVQAWLWRGFGESLPSNGAGSETITDP